MKTPYEFDVWQNPMTGRVEPVPIRGPYGSTIRAACGAVDSVDLHPNNIEIKVDQCPFPIRITIWLERKDRPATVAFLNK